MTSKLTQKKSIIAHLLLAILFSGTAFHANANEPNKTFQELACKDALSTVRSLAVTLDHLGDERADIRQQVFLLLAGYFPAKLLKDYRITWDHVQEAPVATQDISAFRQFVTQEIARLEDEHFGLGNTSRPFSEIMPELSAISGFAQSPLNRGIFVDFLHRTEGGDREPNLSQYQTLLSSINELQVAHSPEALEFLTKSGIAFLTNGQKLQEEIGLAYIEKVISISERGSERNRQKIISDLSLALFESGLRIRSHQRGGILSALNMILTGETNNDVRDQVERYVLFLNQTQQIGHRNGVGRHISQFAGLISSKIYRYHTRIVNGVFKVATPLATAAAFADWVILNDSPLLGLVGTALVAGTTSFVSSMGGHLSGGVIMIGLDLVSAVSAPNVVKALPRVEQLQNEWSQLTRNLNGHEQMILLDSFSKQLSAINDKTDFKTLSPEEAEKLRRLSNYIESKRDEIYSGEVEKHRSLYEMSENERNSVTALLVEKSLSANEIVRSVARIELELLYNGELQNDLREWLIENDYSEETMAAIAPRPTPEILPPPSEPVDR